MEVLSIWRQRLLQGVACAALYWGVGCGGLVTRNDDGTQPGQSPHGLAGAPGKGPTSPVDSCIPIGDQAPCASRSDCCSGMCWFRRIPVPGNGICAGCGLEGEPCDTSGKTPICCSRVCGLDGRCTCAGETESCVADGDCCSGFCYQDRSACLPPRCDPRLGDSADPERCWLYRE